MRGHKLDVVNTRRVSSITRGTVVIVNPCLYDVKGNQDGDRFGVEITLGASKPENERNEITFRISDSHLSVTRIYRGRTANIRDARYADNSPISQTVVMDAGVAFERQLLTRHEPFTQDEAFDTTTKSPSKSRDLHPLPSCLLKRVLECIFPLFAGIMSA